jgi:hypothetical protein
MMLDVVCIQDGRLLAFFLILKIALLDPAASRPDRDPEEQFLVVKKKR